MHSGEILSLEVIEASLATSIVGRAKSGNELWPSIDSTNNRAAALAAAGCDEGVIVLGRQQTAGRGRQGRTWVTPQDAGIAFSVVLRPKLELSRLPLMTLATGVAAAEAVEASVGVRLGLKWVNDLTYGGKKIGGILAEMPSQALIIGVGINVRMNQADLPEELAPRIDWLERIVGKPVDPNLVVLELATKLEAAYLLLQQGRDAEILDRWRKYSVTLGQNIEAQVSGKPIRGRAIDIARSGALILESASGEKFELVAGEISIRLQDGSYC
jgi:BirA family biotin operon repressor/biotin-[acetyl-CoA-carboxylase] ligase